MRNFHMENAACTWTLPWQRNQAFPVKVPYVYFILLVFFLSLSPEVMKQSGRLSHSVFDLQQEHNVQSPHSGAQSSHSIWFWGKFYIPLWRMLLHFNLIPVDNVLPHLTTDFIKLLYTSPSFKRSLHMVNQFSFSSTLRSHWMNFVNMLYVQISS